MLFRSLGQPSVSASPTSARWSGGASPSSNPQPPPFTVTPTSSECYVIGTDKGDTAMAEVLVSPPSKVVLDRVVAYRSDGIAVEITVENGAPKGTIDGVVTRVWPPLDASEWAYVALNPIWQLYVPAPLVK